MKRFKQAKDSFAASVGKELLHEFIKHTKAYKEAEDKNLLQFCWISRTEKMLYFYCNIVCPLTCVQNKFKVKFGEIEDRVLIKVLDEPEIICEKDSKSP